MTSSPISREQTVKAIAFAGIEARRRLVHDQQPRIAQQRLRNPEALPHAAGKSGQRLLAVFVEIGAMQQRLDRFLALLRVGDALQQRQVTRAFPAPRCADTRRTPAEDSPASCAVPASAATRRACPDGSVRCPAPAAWRWYASEWTCPRHSVPAIHTCPRESSERRCPARARRSYKPWIDSESAIPRIFAPGTPSKRPRTQYVTAAEWFP